MSLTRDPVSKFTADFILHHHHTAGFIQCYVQFVLQGIFFLSYKTLQNLVPNYIQCCHSLKNDCVYWNYFVSLGVDAFKVGHHSALKFLQPSSSNRSVFEEWNFLLAQIIRNLYIIVKTWLWSFSIISNFLAAKNSNFSRKRKSFKV